MDIQDKYQVIYFYDIMLLNIFLKKLNNKNFFVKFYD